MVAISRACENAKPHIEGIYTELKNGERAVIDLGGFLAGLSAQLRGVVTESCPELLNFLAIVNDLYDKIYVKERHLGDPRFTGMSLYFPPDKKQLDASMFGDYRLLDEMLNNGSSSSHSRFLQLYYDQQRIVNIASNEDLAIVEQFCRSEWSLSGPMPANITQGPLNTSPAYLGKQ